MSIARLANLVVAGVPKAGTGSLFAYLAQHPDVCGSDIKETGYFGRYNPAWHAGPPPPVEEYARHWAHETGQRYRLEATPNYCYGGPPVIAAMRAVLGKPKVVIILRDPAERLWSAYTFQHQVGHNAGIGSFEQYLDVVEERRRDGIEPAPGDGLSGLHIGFYGEYLGDWLDEFEDDLRVVFMEDLRRDPAALVEGLFSWLDLDAGEVPSLDLGARNVTRPPRSRHLAAAARSVKQRAERLPFMSPAALGRLKQAYVRLNSGTLTEQYDDALRARVEAIYAESNRATAAMLAAQGYTQLPSWLPAGSAV